MNLTTKELVQAWRNTDKRREFLKNYRNWGLWLEVSELGLKYYKFELPKGGRILAMEYTCPDPYPRAGEGKTVTRSTLYLWDGEHFIPNAASEYIIIDLLKKLKAELQNELRSETGVPSSGADALSSEAGA